jgi:hypothetical protein
MDRPELMNRLSGARDAADEHVCALAEEASGLKGSFFPGSAEPILDNVRRFVLAHPFYPDLLPHPAE